MKPVVIIALSVICSVVAVLGVLVAMEMYAINEAKKAVAIELERQKVCDRLYDTTGSVTEIQLWGICINEGIINSSQADVELCGKSNSDYAGLCRTDKKLEAIRWIEREITINQDFYQPALSQKSDLQAERNGYKQNIEIENEKQSQLRADILYAETEDEIIEIYNSCDTPSYKYHSVSCINLLNEIANAICDKYGNNDPTCFTKVQMDIKADRDIRFMHELRILKEVTSTIESTEIESLKDKQNTILDYLDEEDGKTLSDIESDFLKCMNGGKWNPDIMKDCADILVNDFEEYCRIPAEISTSEYEECISEITKIIDKSSVK